MAKPEDEAVQSTSALGPLVGLTREDILGAALADGGHLFLLTHANESVAILREFLDTPETAKEARRAA